METSRPNPTRKLSSDMSFLDKAKDMASKVADDLAGKAGPLGEKAKPLAEKAKPLAEKAAPYAEKAATLAAKGVSSAASTVDKATGGKYHDRIESVSGKLGDALNRDGRSTKQEPGAPSAPTPEPKENPEPNQQ
jgi:phage-related tail protein